ncbi:MAG: hypothetical protein IMZ64_05045 [Bacteroidetes bacterium]|nr:hypothetical protein [Bacteroidota bacterium]
MAKEKKLDVIGNITVSSEVPTFTQSEKESAKQKLQQFVDEEGFKMVRGRFRILDCPDGTPDKIIVRKYKNVPVFTKTMISGGTYEIPLYVARHLQGYDVTATHIGGEIHSCAYAVHGYINKSEAGLPEHNLDQRFTEPKTYVRRYAFESLEFEKAI